MLSAIKTGDRVLFCGGIIGVITNVKEKTYVVRVGDKTKMDVLRGAVTTVVKSGRSARRHRGGSRQELTFV